MRLMRIRASNCIVAEDAHPAHCGNVPSSTFVEGQMSSCLSAENAPSTAGGRPVYRPDKVRSHLKFSVDFWYCRYPIFILTVNKNEYISIAIRTLVAGNYRLTQPLAPRECPLQFGPVPIYFLIRTAIGAGKF